VTLDRRTPEDAPRPIDGRTKIAKQENSSGIVASDIERIIGEVNGTMAIEGMPLADEDKSCIRRVLSGDIPLDEMIRSIIGEYRSEKPQYGLRV
jgi:hypothetical protein